MKTDRTKLERNLPKKGFRKEKSERHIYFYHEFEGKETGISTHISHSRKLKDISGDLLTCMRKQLRLNSNRQVVNLVNCPMDKKAYNSIVGYGLSKGSTEKK